MRRKEAALMAFKDAVDTWLATGTVVSFMEFEGDNCIDVHSPLGGTLVVVTAGYTAQPQICTRLGRRTMLVVRTGAYFCSVWCVVCGVCDVKYLRHRIAVVYKR
jgi:hypothetical protein